MVLARELVDRRETIAKFMRTDVNDLNLKERDVPKEWEERRMSAICRDMIERLGALLRRARWLEAGALILAAVVVVILTFVKA